MASEFIPFEEPPRILVVDENSIARGALCDFLLLQGYSVRSMEPGPGLAREFEQRRYDLIVSAVALPGFRCLDLMSQLAADNRDSLVIVLTTVHDLELAIETTRRGAYDYLLKPFQMSDALRLIQRALHWQRLQQENFHLREAVTIYKLSEAMAQSLSLDKVLDLILETVLSECQTDVASLLLRDPETHSFVEHSRRFGAQAQGDLGRIEGGTGELNFDSIIEAHRHESGLLTYGVRAGKFFRVPPKNRRTVSLCTVSLKVQDRTIGILTAYAYTRPFKFHESQRRLLSVLASRAAASIENARLYNDLVGKHAQLIRANVSLEANFRATVIGFAYALEETDLYTRGHSERVSFYANVVGQGLQLSETDLDQLTQAALMHDIGKIGIRNDKLNKPGKLTPEEAAMFRTHPAKGKRILEPIPFMNPLIPGPFCHHENYDGSGYPQGLMKDNIPLIGRIVAIADTYDAMTTNRSYRRALTHEVAVAEIERCAGSQFDPEIARVFVRCIEEHREQLTSQIPA